MFSIAPWTRSMPRRWGGHTDDSQHLRAVRRSFPVLCDIKRVPHARTECLAHPGNGYLATLQPGRHRRYELQRGSERTWRYGAWSAAHPGQVTVALCAEACSAPYVFDSTMRTAVVNSVFGDGSAAVALISQPRTDPIRIAAHQRGDARFRQLVERFVPVLLRALDQR